MTGLAYKQTIKALYLLAYSAKHIEHKSSYYSIIDALANFYAKALFQADR